MSKKLLALALASTCLMGTAFASEEAVPSAAAPKAVTRLDYPKKFADLSAPYIQQTKLALLPHLVDDVISLVDQYAVVTLDDSYIPQILQDLQKGVTYVDLSNNTFTMAGLITVLKRLPKTLDTLIINSKHDKGVSEEWAKYIPHGLKVLGLSGMKITEKGAPFTYPRFADSLSELDLSNTGLTDSIIRILSHKHLVHGLTKLNLSGNNLGGSSENNTAKALSGFNRCGGTLKWLDISNNGLTAQDIIELKPWIYMEANLVHVDIANNYIGDEGLNALVGEFRHPIKTIDVRNNGVSPTALMNIFSIWHIEFDLTRMSEDTKTPLFNISGNKVTAEVILALSEHTYFQKNKCSPQYIAPHIPAKIKRIDLDLARRGERKEQLHYMAAFLQTADFEPQTEDGVYKGVWIRK